MLIRFTVENFLSFKDEVEFSMVPGRTRKHKDHIYVDDRRKDIRLLKAGVVYGPNAAGKSNLIKAMDFAQGLVVEGRRANQSISAIPFLFDSSTEAKPSKFLFEIKTGRKVYAYKFEVDSKQVHFESLTEIRSSSEKTIFERVTDSEGQTQVTHGSPLVVPENEDMFLEFTARGTRSNQLYLTETIERNIRYFEDVYDWFRKTLVLVYPDSMVDADFGPRYFNNEDNFQQRYRDLIQLYDLDIEDIDLRPLEADAEQFFSDHDKSNISQMISELSEDPEVKAILYNPRLKLFVTVDRLTQYKAYQFITIHYIRHEDRRVRLELSLESDGTIRLFELTPALIRLLSSREEIVFVVDELDRSLHAQMTRNILDIFLSNSVGKPSQLIVTTHESGVLNLDLLRRDEIWFIEKDRYAASQVYSLEEFAPRYDVDIQRGYLNGRYGAIPILPSYNILEWAK